MAVVKKQTRRERAAETRTRMLDAATEVFEEQGYIGARMADIAERAGVAVQTVYFTFHTKPELLRECYAHAVLGRDRVPPPDRPELRAVHTARSGRAALAAFARGATEITARAAGIDAVAKAASHEPEAVEVRTASERLRREGFRELAASVDERFGLRDGLSVDEATDLMLVLSGPSTYLALAEYGWTRERYVAWLADVLATELLRRPGRRADRRAG